MIEAGRVFIPREAAWLAEYLHELEMFPRARYDDQVDSTSQALAWLHASNGPARFLAMLDEVDRIRESLQ